MSFDRYESWPPYVSVAERRAKADKALQKLGKSGQAAQPVRLTGHKIAQSFWGKGWCRHLEAFSDFANRLPRGRSYVRNNAVCHLEIKLGRIEARVMGSSLYSVAVEIRPLKRAAWSALQRQCAGGIGSLLELLQGRLSEPVMRVVTDRDAGLFPKPGEMTFDCSCPDWAGMCKHVAATLYGVGHRLDQQPELLFKLRNVDAQELIGAGLSVGGMPAGSPKDRLDDAQLGAIFGVELAPAAQEATRPPRRTGRRSAPTAQVSGAPRDQPPAFHATAGSVRALRRKLGLSISDFAVRLSVSPASVMRWEASRGPLRLQARCLAALENLRGR